MGILDFENTAPKSPVAGRQAPNAQPRAEAEYYLNFGYTVETKADDGEMITTFVSLATVTALDTINDYDLTRINSEFMRNLRDAQNTLKAQFMDQAQPLEQGQAIIIMSDPDTGLQVELRRRKGAQTAAPEGTNPMARKIAFKAS